MHLLFIENEFKKKFKLRSGVFNTCDGSDFGKAFCTLVRSKGLASVENGSAVSQRWMIYKPLAGFKLSITLK